MIDWRGNVYYSDLNQVWQIAPDGRKRVAVPAPNGDLWLMESSATNQVRVRRIERGGRDTVY